MASVLDIATRVLVAIQAVSTGFCCHPQSLSSFCQHWQCITSAVVAFVDIEGAFVVFDDVASISVHVEPAPVINVVVVVPAVIIVIRIAVWVEIFSIFCFLCCSCCSYRLCRYSCWFHRSGWYYSRVWRCIVIPDKAVVSILIVVVHEGVWLQPAPRSNANFVLGNFTNSFSLVVHVFLIQFPDLAQICSVLFVVFTQVCSVQFKDLRRPSWTSLAIISHGGHLASFWLTRNGTPFFLQPGDFFQSQLRSFFGLNLTSYFLLALISYLTNKIAVCD